MKERVDPAGDNRIKRFARLIRKLNEANRIHKDVDPAWEVEAIKIDAELGKSMGGRWRRHYGEDGKIIP